MRPARGVGRASRADRVSRRAGRPAGRRCRAGGPAPQRPLWEAVGLSMCIPVLAPPQVRGRELFIDGSLVDNLPVKTMADLGEGPIIAVDVKATFEHAGEAQPAAAGRKRVAGPPGLGETL